MADPATNTTTPSSPSQMWVPEPNQRGTFGIISLCLSTLIVCTWNTLHFDIPPRRYSIIRHFFLQLAWMIIALYAPELLLFLAINERVTAGTLLKVAVQYHPDLAEPGMFVSMYRYIRGLVEWIFTRYHPIEPPSPHFGHVHAFYAIMGGFAFYGPCGDGGAVTVEESLHEIDTNPRYPVDVPRFETLCYIMKYFPHILTNIPENVILDRAGSNSLSKALLIIQVGWFCTNCGSRLFQHLSLSLLEISTAAHAFCTLATYFVWWSKPMNVATPTLLMDNAAQEVYALLKCSHEEYDKAWEMAMEMEAETKRATRDFSVPTGPFKSAKIVLAANALLKRRFPTQERPPLSGFRKPEHILVPGNFANKSDGGEFSVSIIMAISPMVYGLVHFLAWNERFPTSLEQRLWWISSFVVTGSGLMGVSLLFLLLMLNQLSGSKLRLNVVADIISIAIIPAVHMLASGFLLVEGFRQLFFLDSTAFDLPSWSKYWPHFS